MTFLEMLLLIEQNKEKVISDKSSSIQTDKFIYVRSAGGEWEQQALLTTHVEERFPPLPVEIPVEKKKRK